MQLFLPVSSISEKDFYDILNHFLEDFDFTPEPKDFTFGATTINETLMVLKDHYEKKAHMDRSLLLESLFLEIRELPEFHDVTVGEVRFLFIEMLRQWRLSPGTVRARALHLDTLFQKT